MNGNRTLFSQIMDYLPLSDFRRCIKRYRGNYRVRTFSCLDQFFCMAFAQLTYRESLRDIEACLRSMQNKLYHMGIRGRVSRNTLAHANERRDWRIWKFRDTISISYFVACISRNGNSEIDMVSLIYVLRTPVI
ncbi:MAG: hypothetical protein A2V45_10955 [Candidatus Aminicenantes bacterium RBG_19FT_COMBO_58_17]|nr:MAG: hypothetical protein A2V45_10955 [Candidatus Aminicenantes bacterium RBG_19FT_COMBO_58_17]